MAIKAVLFDLDGTLLPMDQDTFTAAYFKLLAKDLAPHGYDPDVLIKSVWQGTRAMVKNDGTKTNEEAFWQCFCGLLGDQARNDAPLFDEFYRTRFSGAQAACGFNPQARETVNALRRMGLRLILATNPLFPAIATEQRIRWAGFEPDDFELYTTYENSSFCKPNPAYYGEILSKTGLRAEDCLMVGNDADEDTAAEKIGMKIFLLTDHLLNRSDRDISVYPNGGYEALLRHVSTLI